MRRKSYVCLIAAIAGIFLIICNSVGIISIKGVEITGFNLIENKDVLSHLGKDVKDLDALPTANIMAGVIIIAISFFSYAIEGNRGIVLNNASIIVACVLYVINITFGTQLASELEKLGASSPCATFATVFLILVCLLTAFQFFCKNENENEEENFDEEVFETADEDNKTAIINNESEESVKDVLRVNYLSEKEKIELLTQYKALLDSGALTQDEYDDKKKQLLKN